MTYYCELPNDKNIIRTLNGIRIVGRYVIVTNFIVPSYLAYMSVNIVKHYNDRNIYKWLKNSKYNLAVNETSNRIPLIKQEQQELVFQILKSETW